MSISNVSGSGLYKAAKTDWKSRELPSEKVKKEQSFENPSVRQDRFERTELKKPATYSKSQLSDAQAMQLKDAQRQRMESFQRMLQSMLVKQGETSNLTLFGLQLTVTAVDSLNAAAAIADGGEYSVDAVATRILDMAKALSGGDVSKLSELRDAVEKGFKAAGVELGGKLPGICQDTYTEVMKRFGEWEKEARLSTVGDGE